MQMMLTSEVGIDDWPIWLEFSICRESKTEPPYGRLLSRTSPYINRFLIFFIILLSSKLPMKYPSIFCAFLVVLCDFITRRVLGRAHVSPTKAFTRLAVNKTILKHASLQRRRPIPSYLHVGFSRRNKFPRYSAYDIGESNPVPASGL